MKIAIIGYGHVGHAMEKLLMNHYEIVLFDVKARYSTIDQVNACDLGIVCVPTPMNENGSCNTELVSEVLSWLKTPIRLIKSTVNPGFTMQYTDTVFSPEYIGESKYYNPIYKNVAEMDFVIFGGSKDRTHECVKIFKPVLGPLVKYFETNSITAEIVKYMENSFFATKVTFCNEFYEICKAFNVNYDEVREMWLADQRINRMHTAVFDDNRGFSGKCFPKDVNAIIKAVEEKGYSADLLKQVLKSNNKFKNV